MRWGGLIWGRSLAVTTTKPLIFMCSTRLSSLICLWQLIDTWEPHWSQSPKLKLLCWWTITSIMIIRIKHYNRWHCWSIWRDPTWVHGRHRVHSISYIGRITLQGIWTNWTILVRNEIVMPMWTPWSLGTALAARQPLCLWVGLLILVAIMATPSSSQFWVCIPISFSITMMVASIIIVISPSGISGMPIPSRNLLNKLKRKLKKRV